MNQFCSVFVQGSFLVPGRKGRLAMRRSFCRSSRLGWLGILNVLSPTHSPNPGFWGQSPNSPSRRLGQRARRYAPQRNWCLTPITQRGGLHVAASLKVGKLCALARWLQSECVTATGRHSQIRRCISGPALDFSACRPEPSQSDQALPQRQLVSTCLQQIENPRPQLDGSAPLRTFFSPLNTRPNVAVSSLSAPAGVERVGVRGGIQRIKNKNAAHKRVIRSIGIDHDDQEIPQTSERKIHPPSPTATGGAQ
jgi:hypothetical protein